MVPLAVFGLVELGASSNLAAPSRYELQGWCYNSSATSMIGFVKVSDDHYLTHERDGRAVRVLVLEVEDPRATDAFEAAQVRLEPKR